MDSNSIDITAIVKKVMQSIQADDRRLSGIQNEDGTTVAIMTGYVPAPEKCRELLIKTYGNGIDCLLLHEADFSGAGISPIKINEQDEQLFKRLEKAEKVALVAPGIALMDQLAKGDDRTPVTRALLRALLWGVHMSVVLDFVPPRFARNTFFEKIVDTVDALRAMDIDILEYRCKEIKAEKTFSLLTERDVLDAHRAGEECVCCTKNAIITPLGREALKETGIILRETAWE